MLKINSLCGLAVVLWVCTLGTALAQEAPKTFVDRTIQVGDKKVTGPIAPGVMVDKLIFVSGQLPMDRATGQMPPAFDEQARQALENVKAVLEAAGATMEDVVKVTVLLSSMDNYKAMNATYATYFPRNFPARICYEVSRLPLDAMIEIEAIAIKR